MHFITEIFRHGQGGQSHTGTRPRRLIHLAVDKGCFIDNTGFFHFLIKGGTFTGAFPHTGKNRIPAVFFGDIIDQFLDDNSFSNPCPAE